MLNPIPDIARFARRIVSWQAESGRHDLPWQNTRDPYRIWLSEIMLQQTQVATVVGYYQRFLARFPNVRALAEAPQDEVMPYWAGLGYYARARNLHRCAATIVEHWGGRFPEDVQDIAGLPGIGRSTAAAIAAFAFGKRQPIMDGNVKRVFTRYFGIEGDPSRRAVEKELWDIAEAAIAASGSGLDMAGYTQGQMDLGATVCLRARPRCEACPLAPNCYARRTGAQDAFPARKSKRKQPERHCQMLIVWDKDSILLEQRPEQGIWGGLWSLPQYDDAQAMQAAMGRLGASPGTERPLDPFKHVFSHFALHIQPWLAQADARDRVAEPLPGQDWKSLDSLDRTALPAPIKKLLGRLFQGI